MALSKSIDTVSMKKVNNKWLLCASLHIIYNQPGKSFKVSREYKIFKLKLLFITENNVCL